MKRYEAIRYCEADDTMRESDDGEWLSRDEVIQALADTYEDGFTDIMYALGITREELELAIYGGES